MIDVMEKYYKKIEKDILNESCNKRLRKKVNEVLKNNKFTYFTYDAPFEKEGLNGFLESLDIFYEITDNELKKKVYDLSGYELNEYSILFIQDINKQPLYIDVNVTIPIDFASGTFKQNVGIDDIFFTDILSGTIKRNPNHIPQHSILDDESKKGYNVEKLLLDAGATKEDLMDLKNDTIQMVLAAINSFNQKDNKRFN